MALLLGIDTGGTFTDGVIFDEDRGVLASAKALTRRRDLGRSIAEVIAKLPTKYRSDIRMVSLSTTLATNAIVEGKGSRICLLLLGYSADALERGGLGEALGDDPVVFLAGGHTVEGAEQTELDEAGVAAAARKYGERVSAFAVSGYFGVKNPDHENRARKIIRDLTGKPVTCGHELSRGLHASRRALTAAINARLVFLLKDLITSVQGTLGGLDIEAPVMVVKGDGSLVAADFALEYPIETILSGPAASVLGASYLSGLTDAVVSDIGGTTTDVAVIRDGLPLLNTEGAVVGGFKTMVEAIKIRTEGLGGDSEVGKKGDELLVGPKRVIPLSLLAAEHPEVLSVLREQVEEPELKGGEGFFIVSLLETSRVREVIDEPTETQKAILAACEKGPCALASLYAAADVRYVVDRDLQRLEQHGLVLRSGFTPSDASHVLGQLAFWSREGAELGAKIFSRSQGGALDPAAFSLRVIEKLQALSAAEVLSSCIEEALDFPVEKTNKFYKALTKAAFENRKHQAFRPLEINFRLGLKLVGIGAPAALYYPEIGKLLHTEAVIPPWAEVANAVGAAAGSVIQRAKVLVVPVPEEEGYRVHSAEGIRDFPDLEAAVAFGGAQAVKEAEALAKKAGAVDVTVRFEKRDRIAQAAEAEVFLETALWATAIGRPRFGRLTE